MAENKRFTSFKNNDRIVGFKDNLTKKHHCSYLEAIWILNEIWQKIQRFDEYNQRLKIENERLKEELADFEPIIFKSGNDGDMVLYQKKNGDVE